MQYDVKQTGSKGDTDIGDNVYNTLHLKTREGIETSKTVAEISDYNTCTITAAIPTAADNGDYSHINNIVFEQYYCKDTSVDNGTMYYNDNEYASVEKISVVNSNE
jgi:hypothetical protein